MIYLRTSRKGLHPHDSFELVDSEKESGAYVPLVIATGRLVVEEKVAQGGKVDVALRFVGESTIGR